MGENKKILKIVMFGSQVSLVNRSQDLEKKNKHIYSAYIIVPYWTWSAVLRPLFIFHFDKRAPHGPV